MTDTSFVEKFRQKRDGNTNPHVSYCGRTESLHSYAPDKSRHSMIDLDVVHAALLEAAATNCRHVKIPFERGEHANSVIQFGGILRALQQQGYIPARTAIDLNGAYSHVRISLFSHDEEQPE